MLKISNGDSGNTGVWIDGSIHPREWISAAVVTYIADQLVRTFHEQPDSVTNKDWYGHMYKIFLNISLVKLCFYGWTFVPFI